MSRNPMSLKALTIEQTIQSLPENEKYYLFKQIYKSLESVNRVDFMKWRPVVIPEEVTDLWIDVHIRNIACSMCKHDHLRPYECELTKLDYTEYSEIKYFCEDCLSDILVE